MSGTVFLIGEIVLFMIGATVVGFIFGRLTRRSGSGVNVGELTAVRERTSLLEREVDELTAALTEARATAARAGDTGELQSRVAVAEREAEGLDRRLREAAERIAELESERESGDGRLREATERVAELESRFAADDSDERLRAAGERIAELEAERDELLEQATAPRAPIAAQPATDIDSAADSAELADLRAELERREVEIARLEQVAAEARQLEEALAARDGRIGDLEAALEATAANRVTGDADAASIGTSMGAGNYADSRLEFDAWDPRDEV